MPDNYAPPIVEKIGDEEISFPLLRMKDYAALEAQVRANRASKARSLANECDLKGEKRFDKLLDIEGLDVHLALVRAYVETHDGAKKVFEISLSKTGKTPEQIDSIFSKFEVLEATNLASALVGFVKRVPLESISGSAAPPLSPAQ